MKRTSLVMLLLAVMTVCLSSCSKDEFDKVDNPTFAALYAYLDRDADAVKAEMTSLGFEFDDYSSSDLNAEKGSESYYFKFRNGKVYHAEYGYEASIPATALVTGKSPIKSAVLDMLDAEKQFRSQSSLTSFNGSIETEEETTYTSKDSFLSAVNSLEWKNLSEAKSHSTYSDVTTLVEFTFNELSYGVEK